jgi:hypothetical protein
MIINIISIILTTFFIYRDRIIYYEDTRNVSSSKDGDAYLKFLGGTLCLQIVINIITNIASCYTSFTEVVIVLLYTVIAWIPFIIVVAFKQFLRVPMANVFGYMRNATSIRSALTPDVRNLLTLPVISDYDNFEISASFILTDKGWKTNHSQKPFTDLVLPDSITKLFQIFCWRDLYGEVILFTLSGIMCSFLTEYILMNNTCNSKRYPTIPLQPLQPLPSV